MAEQQRLGLQWRGHGDGEGVSTLSGWCMRAAMEIGQIGDHQVSSREAAQKQCLSTVSTHPASARHRARLQTRWRRRGLGLATKGTVNRHNDPPLTSLLPQAPRYSLPKDVATMVYKNPCDEIG